MTRSIRFLVLLEHDHQSDILTTIEEHRGGTVAAVAYPHEQKKCHELLKSGAVDAVYCAWHARLHLAAAKMAAEHKTHVFIERPMALSSKQCEEIIETCYGADIVLMIGARMYFQPARRYLDELIQRANIRPRHFHSLHFVDDGRPTALASDLLLHQGADCIHAATDVLGGFPDRIAAVSRSPGSLTVAMTYPHGGLATFTCASARGVNYSFANIIGASSTVEVENIYAPYAQMAVVDSTRRALRPLNVANAEVDHFIRCIRKGLPPITEHSGEHGLLVVKTIEAIQAIEAAEKLLR